MENQSPDCASCGWLLFFAKSSYGTLVLAKDCRSHKFAIFPPAATMELPTRKWLARAIPDFAPIFTPSAAPIKAACKRKRLAKHRRRAPMNFQCGTIAQHTILHLDRKWFIDSAMAAAPKRLHTTRDEEALAVQKTRPASKSLTLNSPSQWARITATTCFP